MLNHLKAIGENPKRVVVLGANGFIGGAICKKLTSLAVEVLALGRLELDLLKAGAGKQLAGFLSAGDVLVFASARAPCKNLEMLIDNIQMAKSVCEALKIKELEQVIYISSDAVYTDTDGLISETSCAEPESIHGIMHLTREVALKHEYFGPLAIVRPTLVYGLNDPHNGYGPNRFRRLASSSEDIILFGEGEERRDHVDVEDIAELVSRIIFRKSTGVINAVSGDVVSFRELADFIVSDFNSVASVKGSFRSGLMPHNGYRAFDTKAISEAFPGFRFKTWKQGISRVNYSYKEQFNK